MKQTEKIPMCACACACVWREVGEIGNDRVFLMDNDGPSYR